MSNYRNYTTLLSLDSFRDRFEYACLGGNFGIQTFGDSRYLNQRFYNSREWRDLRDEIIIRDNGCDLGVPGMDISGSVIIHHLQPVTLQMVLSRDPLMTDPNNLICVSYTTHKALHYGDESMLAVSRMANRSPYDPCPWKGGSLCPTL